VFILERKKIRELYAIEVKKLLSSVPDIYDRPTLSQGGNQEFEIALAPDDVLKRTPDTRVVLVVRSALRLLERQENQLAALRAAVEAGERSGESNAMYKLSNLAAENFAAIYEYTLLNFGALQADIYTDDLDKTFQLLSGSPLMGYECPEIAVGVRRH